MVRVSYRTRAHTCLDSSGGSKDEEEDELDAFMNSMQSSANAKSVESLKKRIPVIELVRVVISVVS